MKKSRQKYRVLILESGSGGGHVSISQAIGEALEKKYSVQVSRADVVPALLHKFYRLAVRQTSSTAAELHQLIYKISNNPESAELTARINLIFNRKKFASLIERHQPDLVISDTSLAVREVPRLLNKVYRRIPFLVFVADPVSVHSTWFSSLTDLTMVSTIHVYQKALEHGLDPHQVVITGHPVRSQFYQSPGAKSKLRQSLGLHPRVFTIFFGGSGEGSRHLLEILKLLQKQPIKFQGIVVTGNNPQLKKQIETLTFPTNIKLKVFGFVKQVAPLLFASDLVVAKAGPNLLFESVIAGKPFLATHHVRGQEDGNLEIIRHAQVGWVEENSQKAVELIKEIVQNPALIKATRLGIKYFGEIHKPAAKKIAELAYRYLTGEIPPTTSWEKKKPGPLKQALVQATQELKETIEKSKIELKSNPEVAPLLEELRENWKKIKQFLESGE